MSLTDYDEAQNRLECLKLAQQAEDDANSLAYPGTMEVIDRAAEYADFVNELDAKDQPSDPEREKSLTELFEEGMGNPYEPVEYPAQVFGSTFGTALHRLKRGKRVARKGWNGKGMWLELQTPDAFSKMDLPYIYMRTAQGDLVPWLASQTDLLAEDWFLV